jgi:hypothetical protein
MPEAAVLVRPSRTVRRLAWLSLLVGAAASGLYATMGLMGHGTRLLIPVAVVTLVLVGRPVAVLRGRTRLSIEEITVRRPPIGRVVVPVSAIGLVEMRRGLLLEWPVLYLRDGSVVELAAPTRLWFRRDPAFDRDVALLRALVRHRAVACARCRWSPPRLLAGPLLTATAVVLLLIDPPWASDAWPLRPHATRLPDACRMFDARVRRLLPGAQVDRTFSRSDESSPYVSLHTCQWNATHRSADGMTLADIGRLSVEVALEHGVGATSDAQEAHQEFARQIAVAFGESETRVAGIGDEAELIVEHPDAAFAWVVVATRKANVEEKIDLVWPGRGREREAAAAAEGLARLGLSEVHFS